MEFQVDVVAVVLPVVGATTNFHKQQWCVDNTP